MKKGFEPIGTQDVAVPVLELVPMIRVNCAPHRPRGATGLVGSGFVAGDLGSVRMQHLVAARYLMVDSRVEEEAAPRRSIPYYNMNCFPVRRGNSDASLAWLDLFLVQGYSRKT